MTHNYNIQVKHIIHTAIVALIMMVGTIDAGAFDLSHYADTSRLATGKWVKVAVSESGIYQITASDAQKWGLGDLSTVRIFGYGGKQLSEVLNSSNFHDDLPQVPVLRTADRILFYAVGPLSWSWNNTQGMYVQSQHPYATEGYYFVTSNSSIADIAPEAMEQPLEGDQVTSFVERVFHEQELVNPGETGRMLLGEDFTVTNTQAFKFTLNGMINESTVDVLSRFGAKTLNSESSVSYKYNGNNVGGSNSIKNVSGDDPNHYHYNVALTHNKFSLGSNKELTYTVTYSPAGTVNLARLDYITVNYNRNLDMSGMSSLPFALRNRTAAQYVLSGTTASTHVWDVTSSATPVDVALTSDGGKSLFSLAQDEDRELIAFNTNGTFPSPSMVGNVDNQSIHGMPIPDMIILAPSEFLTQAQQLASLHESVDSMRVLVLDHKKVFNEFSSGTPDASAYRLLCKYFYDRGTDDAGHRLGYLLLMGNGYCDNRQITNAGRALNYPKLLVWESVASEDEMRSYTSDDYFGYLQDGSRMGSSGRMQIAVGRIPARNTTSASIAVNKIIKYMTQPDYGNWKNSMLNVADNEDNGNHWIHGEAVIENVAANGGENTNFNRVFLDNFEEKSDGSGSKFPDARKKMFKTLTEGVLWWNYSGHGGPSGWTGDGLLVPNDMEQNLFYSHQPILFAATCEFSRHDGSTPSGGENAFFNPNGGCVALMCPPRLVYMSDNRFLNITAAQKMYSRDSNGQVMRLGDLLTYAKNNTSNGRDNSLRYHLYGDPAMRPAMPQYNAVIDKINGNDITPDAKPVLQARQTMVITGHIENMAGETQSGFNGLIESTLYDCEKSISFVDDNDIVRTYEERQNKLSLNVSRVSNGQFTFSIIIPSEVNCDTIAGSNGSSSSGLYDNYRPSLVSLYAYDTDNKTEATGSCQDFIIYGFNDDDELNDTIGPTISYMGLNSNNFNDGDNVNDSPLLIASISDESGINFSSAGVGHNMTLTLDGNVVYSDVSSYYTPVEAEKGTAGSINYGLSNLEMGHHTLKLKVWDVFNNSSEKTISFNVMNGVKPEIDDIKAVPNPATTTTTFTINHNRPEANITVTIEVFNLMGQRMWSTTESGRSSMFSSFPIVWNLTDYSGSRLQRGIYLYKATISTDGHQESTKTKKIAITAP